MSGQYYASLDMDTRNVNHLVIYDGKVTAPNYYALSEADYKKIKHLIMEEELGVNIAENGLITTYILPSPPLKEQADQALEDGKRYIMNNYMVFNDPTPDNWVTYLKTLRDISDGTDTTSTKLPQSPLTQDKGQEAGGNT